VLPAEVLKFGSSVLARPEDLPLAVDEVYRRLREGYRVLAVVSAFAGEPDWLLSRTGNVLGPDAVPEATAAYVATGELQSAALLTGTLLRALRLRWQEERDFWARLLAAAQDGDEEALSESHLHAKLLLSGTLVARSTVVKL